MTCTPGQPCEEGRKRGRVLGALMYRVAGDRRRIAKRNLELCFPDKTPAWHSRPRPRRIQIPMFIID